jgi:hypothetical protein
MASPILSCRRRPTVPRVCELCATPFLAFPWDVNRGGARFCSKNCSNAYNCGVRSGDTLQSRFWRKVDKSAGPEGCWLWTGGTRSGYGAIRAGSPSRQMLDAHVLSCEWAHGPSPNNCHALHTCDVKRCVNPVHLYWGTPKQNTADAIERGRYASGERNGMATLADETVEAIRRDRQAGLTFREIAARYGVSAGHACNITKGKRRHRDNDAEELLTGAGARPGREGYAR